jgi:hypothetical protein
MAILWIDYLTFFPRFKVANCDIEEDWDLAGVTVTNCDLKASVSSEVSWNMKSSEKRSALRFTASLSRLAVGRGLPPHGYWRAARPGLTFLMADWRLWLHNLRAA